MAGNICVRWWGYRVMSKEIPTVERYAGLLGASRNTKAILPLVRALADPIRYEMLGEEPDHWITGYLDRALSLLKDEVKGFEQVMMDLLRSPDLQFRSIAVLYLRNGKDPHCADAVVHALEHSFAITPSAPIKRPLSVGSCMYESVDETTFQHACVLTLCSFKNDLTLDVLVSAYSKASDTWLRQTVIWGLAQRHSDAAWALLVQALSDPNKNIREDAIRWIKCYPGWSPWVEKSLSTETNDALRKIMTSLLE